MSRELAERLAIHTSVFLHRQGPEEGPKTSPRRSVADMRTEPPADRLRRRLIGADTETDPESGEDPDDDPKALLPRWLPDPNPDRSPLRDWATAVRADPGRAGVIGLVVVAAMAVLVTVFTLVREEPTPVVSAKLPPVQMTATSTSDTTPASGPGRNSGADQPVVISVVGLVKTPGLVTVAPGSRVADAISAAGGMLSGADTVGLNMARRVADGEQVVVGIAPAPGRPPALGSSISAGPSARGGGTGESADNPDGVVDLNNATVEQLDTLPGVGPVTAAAIVSWRDQHGPFTSVDQLGEVDGIGPARLAKLRDLVRV